MTKFLWLGLLLLTAVRQGEAQQLDRFSIAATSEAIGLPFTNYLPYHPGIEFKLGLLLKETRHNIQHFNTTLGMYLHRRLETGIYMGGEYQYTQKLFSQKLGLTFPVGLGYSHTFYPGELYQQVENGDFEQVFQFGRPHFYVNGGVGLIYLGSKKIQPFIQQIMFVKTPFANGIPVMIHSFLKIGIHIKISNDEN